MPLTDLQTVDQVAAALGMHPKTVLEVYRRGDLPGIKLGARTLRFHPDDVAAYVEARRVVRPAL